MERTEYGLIEADATHCAPLGQPDIESENMVPRVAFKVHDIGGALNLSMFIDFSKCAVAEKLGQKTMMIVMDELNHDSLEALDLFLAVKLKALGITSRYVAE